MKLTMVMQSYLYEYEGGASNRVEKFHRALAGFAGQTESSNNIELIVVSHGCPITKAQFRNFVELHKPKNFRYFEVERNLEFEGFPRDVGIENAKGEYISYLDSDDMLVADYCEKLIDAINFWNNPKWAYFNDFIRTNTGLSERKVKMQKGSIGTSNLCHRKDLFPDVRWEGLNGYGHDWDFILRLKEFGGVGSRFQKMGYVVCHIPLKMDY
jgi:glycosyltransferase involved in cell wall biosynthesis